MEGGVKWNLDPAHQGLPNCVGTSGIIRPSVVPEPEGHLSLHTDMRTVSARTSPGTGAHYLLTQPLHWWERSNHVEALSFIGTRVCCALASVRTEWFGLLFLSESLRYWKEMTRLPPPTPPGLPPPPPHRAPTPGGGGGETLTSVMH